MDSFKGNDITVLVESGYLEVVGVGGDELNNFTVDWNIMRDDLRLTVLVDFVSIHQKITLPTLRIVHDVDYCFYFEPQLNERHHICRLLVDDGSFNLF